jgi:ABC-2 type transport system ATP-binding protein
MDEGRTSADRSPAIAVRGLSKRFGDVVALDGLDLEIARGRCFGLLGPNGAGKTTTVSVLATLLRPDAGSVRILGHDVVSERAAVRREIGIVFQEPSLDRELTAREQLDLHARLYHLPERVACVKRALAEAGLEADADRPVRGFSGGMKRRLEVARGLLHRPRVLFLDEPTLGLDVAARAGVWERVRALRTAGDVTVLLTTHSMEEADGLCDEIAIVDRGRVVALGTPEALKRGLGGDVVELGLERGDGVEAVLGAVAGVGRVIRDLAPVTAVPGVRLRVTVAEGSRRLPALLEAARDFGVIDVALHRPTLEHVFLHHTGHVFEPATRDGSA